jgi:hypothetical protein
MTTRKFTDPQCEISAEIGHIRGLVLIRRMLAERGATPAELRDCDAVIGESRKRIADAVRAAEAYAAEAYASAAA